MIYVPDSLLLHSVRESAHCLVNHADACESGRGVKWPTTHLYKPSG